MVNKQKEQSKIKRSWSLANFFFGVIFFGKECNTKKEKQN